MILIPSRPSSPDMRRAWNLINTLTGKPIHLITNQARRGTKSLAELHTIAREHVSTATWDIPLSEKIMTAHNVPEKQFATVSQQFFGHIADAIHSEFTVTNLMADTSK